MAASLCVIVEKDVREEGNQAEPNGRGGEDWERWSTFLDQQGRRDGVTEHLRPLDLAAD